ncbi:MAG: gliding motility-associated ABC transporter substrate-binding protein GldG [Saprospiraceae bacterium]|uniref:Gliding motility-associated ABC transporter substrate-binding protein GldG n=1 Tax=Candidatus Opimibacter skivensis TaxID=2982028 RepID=A0A9D7SSL4_9BACT|nr:gliding motility-associated ABC transporter substrate-binding protein GldG [Candidatus Opimibacter skivensis]
MSKNLLSSAHRKVSTTAFLISGILIFVYILSQWLYVSIDATEERRFTLAPATKQLLKSLDDRIYIKVLLAGKFPAGFKRLQESTEDILRRFAQVNPDIQYNFDNPNIGTVDEINARRKQLKAAGLIPTQLRVSDASSESTQEIYPFAIINYGSRSIPVPLLQDDIPGADKDVIINNSISLLEYKIADGIQKIKRKSQVLIAFSMGQGELTHQQTASIEKDLQNEYVINRINLDSVVEIPQDIRALIIAKPREKFSEIQLFMLDQYVMHGGNIMFLIDPLNVSLDSININKYYIPPPYELGLDPLLFKYGARVNPNLVLDLQCTRIPMVVGMQGDKVQTELYPWYYYPLITSTSDHPITKGLDRIQLEFPSSIDTIQTASHIKKTILLTSSKYSRLQLTPVRLNFAILHEQLDPTLFNKGPQGFAVMLEGSFQSMFQNRLSAEQMEVLHTAGLEFKGSTDKSKVMIVTDGDIIKNLVNPNSGEPAPLGYNKYENTTFTGNRDFLLNSLEYMLDESGVLEARLKDVKLRLLDSVKAREEGVRWQLINILGPLALIFILGMAYQFFRKRKFGKLTN